MKRFTVIPLLLGFLTASPVGANLLINTGFEDPITIDGPPFVGFWEGFSGGAGSLAGNSTLMPRSGAQSLGLSIDNTVDTFAGVFQDVPGLISGTQYTFGGWHATPSSPLDLGVEIRIEWRNSVSNIEISRTPNLTPVPTAAYFPFNLTAAVPDGADTGRVVYAVQSFSTNPLGNGTVLVDDVSFDVIPEPSTALLLAIGALGLAGMRRKRAA
ncbi:MAG TPA: PEP-CTERM sorting domain-containing protein [Verrucomicrobiales bacterium]|nr:PEP-CTERM sorting domain-containing protein [Verrucomicrobiales bacterium]